MRRFIAPERRAGDAPSARSDLYSLGVLLWELLTAQILPTYELDPGLAIPTVRTIAPGLDIPDALDGIVMRALSDVEYRFRDAQEMAQALRDVLETASPPVLAAPALPVAAAPVLVAPILPIAAAAVVATLPAPTLAADAASSASTSSLAAPSSPSTASSPTPPAAPTAVQLAVAAPSAVLTRKGLSVLLSIAFAGGSAAGAAAVQVATTGEADTGTFERSLAPDVDILERVSTLPSHHVPLVASSRPTATPLPPDPTTNATSPRRALRSSTPSPQVARARKGILDCNPPKAQLTATVVIDQKADGEPRVRFNGHEFLGVFGDCALQVAQTLSLRADQPMRFKL